MSTQTRSRLQGFCRILLLFLLLRPFPVLAYAGIPEANLQPARAKAQAATSDVRIEIYNPIYIPDRNLYEFTLAVTDPQVVKRVIVTVRDVRQGVDIGAPFLFDNVQEVIPVELDATPLLVGHEYEIQVRAIDRNDTYLFIANGSSDALTDILAKHSLMKLEEPTSVPPFIESVSPTLFWTSKGLLDGKIAVRLVYSLNARVDRYRVVIIDNELKSEVYSEAVQLLNGRELIEIPLPEAMRNPLPAEYQLSVYFGQADNTFREEPATMTFKTNPPPKPSTIDLLWRALSENSWAQITVGIILLCCTLWILVSPFKRRKPEILSPPPPVDYTHADIGGVMPDQPKRLRVKLVRAPNQQQKLDQVITRFPCEIGRHKDCQINLTDATPDQHISRHHIRITAEDGALYLIDLGSNNGTYAGNKRLEPKSKVRLTGTTLVRLGPETTIELRPE